jgi:methionyl-tRNA formyltransferase
VVLMTAPRIIYAGTPDFAVPALSALLENSDVVAVYTQPDRPAGRGRKPAAPAVKERALQAGLPVLQPTSLKGEDAQRELAELRPDLLVVAAYGLILPRPVLEIPRLGCINIHASLLPAWRGAAPIQRALLAGDTETGISIMRMEVGLDTGPVYRRFPLAIDPLETAGELTGRLADLGATALLSTLPGILDGSAVPTPQRDAEATYAQKVQKSEAQIDWSAPAEQIARSVRAFAPWPVAQTVLGDETLRIWSAHALSRPEGSEPTPAQEPGRVQNAGPDGIDVDTGDGVVRITELQAPGKRRMSARDFVNSRRLDGCLLG